MDLPPLDRLSLFFDIDGTLIDIAERPQDVVVPPDLLAALGRAQSALGGALAFVSGRSISNVDDLFSPLKVSVSGVHGAELRLGSDGDVHSDADTRIPRAIVDEIHAVVEGFERTIVEDKDFSVAVHYRRAPEAAEAIRAGLVALIARHGDEGLRILPGHMVFEVKRATFDKGMAIRRFMGLQPFRGRTPVFLGDDVTDKPGFDAVLAEGGYAYSVGQVMSGLSGMFPDPAAVRAWVGTLVPVETAPA